MLEPSVDVCNRRGADQASDRRNRQPIVETKADQKSVGHVQLRERGLERGGELDGADPGVRLVAPDPIDSVGLSPTGAIPRTRSAEFSLASPNGDASW